jgi:Ricin-type beta-trefoil lectin domain
MRRPVFHAVAAISVLLVGIATTAVASADPARVLVDSYVVSAQEPDLALSIEDNSSNVGARAELAPFTGAPEQRWGLSENDITDLRNIGTGKCLEFADAPWPARPVVQAECDGTDQQTWYYVAADAGFGSWRFQNVATDTCITAADLRSGASLFEAPCDEEDARQQWTSVEPGQ